MKAVDTNVLVRYLVQDDAAQGKRAADIVESAVEQEGLYIGSIVLCELVWVLDSAYDFDKSELVGTLERILQTAGFSFERKDVVRAALEEYRAARADFSDCLIGKIHQSLGCQTTITFDRALRKLGTFQVL